MSNKFLLLCLGAAVAVSAFSSNALALPEFKKAFEEKYVKKSKNAQFKADFKKAGCNTCHVKGKKKVMRNAYGDELAKLIEGDANKRINEAKKQDAAAGKDETAKVLEELDKAFDDASKLNDPNGQPYGEIIESGKLPIPLPE